MLINRSHPALVWILTGCLCGGLVSCATKPAAPPRYGAVQPVPAGMIRDGSGTVYLPETQVEVAALPVESPAPTATVPTVRKDSFTVGSTKDEVAVVMGAPKAINEYLDTWQFEYSIVNFREGRVIGWNNISDNLKVHYAGESGRDNAAKPKAAEAEWKPVTAGMMPARAGVLREVPYSTGGYSSGGYTGSTSPAHSTGGGTGGYVAPHYRSGTHVKGYFRKNETYVSPHYRSGGRVKGHYR